MCSVSYALTHKTEIGNNVQYLLWTQFSKNCSDITLKLPYKSDHIVSDVKVLVYVLV